MYTLMTVSLGNKINSYGCFFFVLLYILDYLQEQVLALLDTTELPLIFFSNFRADIE